MVIHGGHAVCLENGSSRADNNIFDFAQRLSDTAFINVLVGTTLKESKDAQRLTLERLVKQTE